MRSNNIIFKLNWHLVGSFMFFLWGIVNTWLSVSRYGIEQGTYFWFCNIGLFLIAYGLLRKDASWLIGFLGFAIITQFFWFIDNIYRIFMGKNLLGLAEFLYQPGYPMDEFIVSHYHFFMIPTAITALFFVKRKYNKVLKLTVFGSSFVLLLSYLLFPKEQNINCIRYSCVRIFGNMNGQIYSFIFALIIIILGTFSCFLIEKIHQRIHLSKRNEKFVICVFVIFLIFIFGLLIADVNYKRTLPKFRCSEPFENSGITISCKYTSEFKEDKMLLVYAVKNAFGKQKFCTSKISINGKEATMHKNLYLEPHKKYNAGFILDYPKEDVIVKLIISC